MTLQEKLTKWANETAAAYHKLAKENDFAFYTQSDLSKIESSPELMIIGINPGSGGTYTGQKENPNWGLNGRNMGGEQLLKGNFYIEKNGKTSWDNHKKWSYWSGLKRCLSNTHLSNDIEDNSKIIVTNASFFSTTTAKEISENLLIKTIPHTLDLIDISNPKHIMFLSGKKCFERLSRLSISSKLFKFEYKLVCGNIYIGNLNGKLCIGIPHPAYKTNEELNLVASVIPYLINLNGLKDLNTELIKKECSKQINDYEERLHNKISSVKIDKARIAEEIVSKIDLKPYDEKNHRYFLSDNIEITITHKDNGCVELRPIHNINLPDEYINSLKGKLLEKGYNVDVKVWIGRKLFTQFDQNGEDIVNCVLEEINELKDLCAAK